MKTLVYEPDPLRARAYASRLGAAHGNVDVVSSADHAAALMQTGGYGRLALRRGQGDGEAERLAHMQRMTQPSVDVLDLSRMPGRSMALEPAGEG